MIATISTDHEDTSSKDRIGNVYAALARTATRSLALYFSRPVRLFRPSKVSGWHSLKGLALQHGSSLNLGYIRLLVKDHGIMVIPKHLVPPMVVNALLGAVLWSTYSEASAVLSPYLNTHPTTLAATAGAISGATQALIAAPAENVRLVIEGGAGGHGWSHAWKEVFRGTQVVGHTKRRQIEDIRQVRYWMKEVGDMAGRGWDGWGWGCAKDACGFAAFFTMFEITRRTATQVENKSRDFAARWDDISDKPRASFVHHIPRILHGVTLVTGGALAGLAYEYVSRPFDAARKAVKIEGVIHPGERYSPWQALIRKFRDDGLPYFFRDPAASHFEHNSGTHHKYKRLASMLRILGRVGPWGVGFLVWEAYGPSITS
ncbi:hypothetical protein PC9H_001410 [Pleurotus ostreatus]|uniref:Uncharacterized protein n=1 Tax=Pleurotus ostreatus TaxID=5322 RepID=A0A8H7A6S3_PLEOS|nr:uncharacterized protein PC9H_001410 [Pleurotus ostreatus]KAF7441061.1 hypothetical protein PC9H_001410 [Pleurotus ostreatus]KAJ8699464.1 hypothetical protein PTI98_002576 [Pleurotus ostreatus]